MYLLNRRSVLSAGGAALSAGAAASLFPRFARASKAETLVHTASPQGGAVDSVVIVGDSKALLIDAQFIKQEAEVIKQQILETGRDLETIFVSHYHPDHHFGLAVFAEQWPDAKIVAHPKVAEKLSQVGQAMFDDRKTVMGDAMPDQWLAPQAMDGSLLKLEGEEFEVLDPLHGDTNEITAVHMPQFDTIVTADLVFNGTHIWLRENTEPEQINKWRQSLETLEAIGAGTVIPGHRTADAQNDASGYAHTKMVLDAWEESLALAGSKEELKEMMLAKVGNLPGEFFLDMAVSGAYPG